MTEGNIQYSKVNSIYLRGLGWRRYYNHCFASVNNDFSGLQYITSPSQIYVIYIMSTLYLIHLLMS